MSNWSKEEVIDKVKKMSNNALLDETLSLAAGDSYDGCFTREGEFEYETLQAELYSRLKECGFLSNQVL